jgi:hypothetical protein
LGVIADLDHRPTRGSEILRGPRGQTADGAVVVDSHLAAIVALVKGTLVKGTLVKGTLVNGLLLADRPA